MTTGDTTFAAAGSEGPADADTTDGSTTPRPVPTEIRPAPEDKYRAESGTVLLTGVQALVRLVFDQIRSDRRAGLRTAAFVSGYPGSPLGGFDRTLAATGPLLEEMDVRWVPGVNEDLAATAVWGSQQDGLAPLAHHQGVVGLWYGKAPGVDRSGDVFRHANWHGVGTNGGVVLAVGDDPASKSSTMPSHSEFALADAMIPVLSPGTPQEVLDLGLHAYAASRLSGCWSALKIVSNVADGFASVRVDPDRLAVRIPELSFDGHPWRFRQAPLFFLPATLEIEADLAHRRMEAVRAYAAANALDRLEVDPGRAWLGIVASGRTFYEVRQALADLGLSDADLAAMGVRLLKLALIHPVEPSAVRRLARGVEEVLVVEEKRGFVEAAVREILYGAGAPRLVGKRDEHGRPLVPADGELSAARLAPLLAARIAARVQDPRLDPGGPAPRATPVSLTGKASAPVRTAHFCSGCPHNRSTVETSGSPVGGGVGCHAMVLWMDRGATSYTHMGGEGAQWIGRAPFTDVGHFVANMGDGTFFHSGSLAVRAAVAAGVTMTFKLLHNGVVAMTGGQDPTGQRDVPDVCRQLSAEGVSAIIVCAEEPKRFGRRAGWPPGVRVWPRQRLAEAERTLAATPGVTVLIYDQACAAELRRLRKKGAAPTRTKRVVINEAVCEGCGDCGAKSSCLSVHPVDTAFGRKTRIHQSSCNTDYSCLEGDCPSFVTVDAPATAPPHGTRPDGEVPPDPSLPAPGPAGFGVYSAGVGGTGVVTVNQVLATAAALAGLHVTGLDQTGLSQKGGPVVSHLRMWAQPADASNAVGTGGADCMLFLDLLAAADPAHLRRGDPERSVAVAVTGPTPTASQVRDPDVGPADEATLVAALGAVSRRVVTIPAGELAEDRFGDHMPANMIALGAAYQAGGLPVPAEAIERAIRLNGVAVESNLSAFRLGRGHAAGQHGNEGTAGPGGTGPRLDALLAAYALPQPVGAVAAPRAADLAGYQNLRLARSYLDAVRRGVDADRRCGSAAFDIGVGVAVGLHKLMAYKDEYEVARLHLAPEFRAQLAAAVPGGRRVRYQLHPPVLRSMGLDHKIALPAAVAQPTFRALRAMRHLRGTSFDPFGRAEMRRLERRLLAEYSEVISACLADVTPETHHIVAHIARLPEMVRGYEQVKTANVARYTDALAQAMSALADAGRRG